MKLTLEVEIPDGLTDNYNRMCICSAKKGLEEWRVFMFGTGDIKPIGILNNKEHDDE